MAAAAKLNEVKEKGEVQVLALPKPAASKSTASKTAPRSRTRKVPSDSVVELAVVPRMTASRPASRVDSTILEIDSIIDEVEHAIATNEDKYKCIMFTDLESSTEYKRDMGHTKGYMRNRLFCDICENAVKQHNGQVVKRLGDGVMVVFENAIDALLTSLLIKRTIAENRKKLKKLVGPMNYRIGITCGYVKEIPGRPKDYIGHAMDKGARIQTHALRNQVLIDEIVYGLIHTKIRDYSGDILIGSPKNMTLKGVGISTLYEVSPKNMGLESSMFTRLRNMFH